MMPVSADARSAGISALLAGITSPNVHLATKLNIVASLALLCTVELKLRSQPPSVKRKLGTVIKQWNHAAKQQGTFRHAVKLFQLAFEVKFALYNAMCQCHLDESLTWDYRS